MRSHLKILGVRRVTCSMFLIEDPQILGALVQNLVAMVTWGSVFVRFLSRH